MPPVLTNNQINHENVNRLLRSNFDSYVLKPTGLVRARLLGAEVAKGIGCSLA